MRRHRSAPALCSWCITTAVTIAGGGRRFSKGAYTLGKVVFGKGWEELLELLAYHQRTTDDVAAVAQPSIDAYGSGEAFDMVRAKPKTLNKSNKHTAAGRPSTWCVQNSKLLTLHKPSRSPASTRTAAGRPLTWCAAARRSLRRLPLPASLRHSGSIWAFWDDSNARTCGVTQGLSPCHMHLHARFN